MIDLILVIVVSSILVLGVTRVTKTFKKSYEGYYYSYDLEPIVTKLGGNYSYKFHEVMLGGQDLTWNHQVRSFSEILRYNKTVQKLSLWKSKLDDRGARMVIQASTNKKKLKTAVLWGNRIGNSGASSISRTLQRDDSYISNLDLHSNHICDSGAKDLATAVQTSKQLKNLNLYDNCISPAGAIYLAEAVQRSESIQSLNLRKNAIGAEGAAALSRAASYHDGLVTVLWDSRSAEEEDKPRCSCSNT